MNLKQLRVSLNKARLINQTVITDKYKFSQSFSTRSQNEGQDPGQTGVCS